MSQHRPEEVSGYDRLVWPEATIAQLLASGERRRELRAFFGTQQYDLLQQRAAAAAVAAKDPDRVVYVIPGIMGSQLGVPRERPLPDNLLWPDPADIHLGHLSQLALTRSAVRASGPVLHNYLPLKFALEAAGYTVRCFDYDWRRDLSDTVSTLGLRLAADSAPEISIVGHSMGGLIARATLGTTAGAHVQRVVTLGTPHGGSFAPLQSVRGVYPLVRQLAQLDSLHNAEELARDVFATFHSLYQMLPRDCTPNLLDARSWPRTGPQPNATLLDRAALLDLGRPDARLAAIAGYGFDTPVQATLLHDEFYYRYDHSGDGTVPTSRATLVGAEAWYCQVAHNDMMRSALVHDAILQLLIDAAPRLPGAPPVQQDAARVTSDSELRARFAGKINWSQLDAAQRQQFMDGLNTPAQPA
jgi:pimeloyl-ACP methyl ester carboxylesterase